MKTASIWSADAGVQKQILKRNGTIKASVSDVFKTLEWSANSHFAGQDVAVAGRSESRQLRLNFTYRFGNKTLRLLVNIKPVWRRKAIGHKAAAD